MSDKKLQMDRTITFGLVLAVLVQTAGALLWAGAAEARLSQLETQAAADLPVAERLARLEEQMTGARQSLTRIERRLDAKE
jgi:hypothetical protein